MPLINTSLGRVQLATSESPFCLWRVSDQYNLVIADTDGTAYYKMPESLGPEYEWYNGCLVLYVLFHQ